MRIGIDGRSLAGGPDRGVAHVTRSLAGALAAAGPDDRLRILVPGRSGREWPAELRRPNVTILRHPLPSRALFGAAALTGRPRLDRLLGGALDVLWAPAPAPLAVSRHVPLVVSVHDLSFLERPHDFTAYERLWHRLARPERLVHEAAATVAVSEATRAAVAARWGLHPTRVALVRNGVARPVRPPDPAAARAAHGLPERYLLFVGALEPRKAPDVLVAAYRRARERGLDAGLVLAGEGRLGASLDGPGVRRLGHVTSGDLPDLYAGALALVMPSWLEGFGLPPAEALAAGTPAVVSDLPVFAETLDEGALRVPAGDAEALAEAMLAVAGDPELRARLAAAGARAIAPLTWERAARELRAVLADASENRTPPVSPG